MARKRISIRELAVEAGTDLDETLIALWDAGFDQVTDAEDYLDRGEANRARRALGLATRRELASAEYWQSLFEFDRADLERFLVDAAVPDAFDRNRLRKRAIHRLKAEAARRELKSVPAQAVATADSPTPVYPHFEWQQVGRVRNLKHITVPQVEAIHAALVADFTHTSDPIDPPGIRSRALLESSVHRPETSLGGLLKYPTVEMAAAALLHAIVHDHPFHNGNKRTALVSTLVFLDENGIVITCDENALFKMLLQLAQHSLVHGPRDELADREMIEVASWLSSCARWIEKGDRALPWRRLRQILTSFGCELSFPGGVGNRINITRRMVTKGMFGREREVVLKTQVFYGDEGRENQPNAIHQIRYDLHLDDEHGIDSSAFYDQAETPPSEFIVRYRKTLRRLARV